MYTLRSAPHVPSGPTAGRSPRAGEHDGPRPNGRRLLVAVSATATLALGSLALGAPATAAPSAVSAPADGGPIGGLLGGVTKTLGDVTRGASSSPGRAPSKAPARSHAPSHAPATHGGSGSIAGSVSGIVSGPSVPRSSSSAGSSTGDSSANHASGSVARTTGHRTPGVTVSGGQSQAGRHQAGAQASLLAIGSWTIFGSQASSDGDGTGHGPVPANGLCEMSGGRLCLDLLYADSSAASADGDSDASTRTGVADTCLGGDDATGTTCSGLHLGVADSQSDVHTTPDGTDNSSSSGSLANFCADQAGSCLLAGELLGSSSASGTDAGAAQKPTFASLLLGGYAVDGPDDQVSTEVPKGCDTEVLCSTLNDKTTRPGSDDSGSAADLSGLGDAVGAGLGNSDTGSSASSPSSPTSPAPGTGAGHQGGSARSVLADVGLGAGDDRTPLVGVSRNQSSGDLSETQGDATLLSLFGHDVIASHADSDGDGTGHGPVPGNPLCDSSGGALCLDALYADSAATKADGSSSSHTRTGIAAACVGGHDATGRTCDGVEAGVGQGSSSLTNNGTSGKTSSSTSTSLAQLCLHGTDGCTVSGDALASRASADSTGKHSQRSSILGLGAAGEHVAAPSNPIDLAVPGECDGANPACLFLNQVKAGADPGATSAGATVVGLTGVGDAAGATAGSTRVSATGGEPTAVQPPSTEPPAADPPRTVVRVDVPRATGSTGSEGSSDAAASGSASAAPDGVLPNTGGVPGAVVALGLALLTAGGATVLIGRRRHATR